jgi:hypothetical protein
MNKKLKQEKLEQDLKVAAVESTLDGIECHFSDVAKQVSPNLYMHVPCTKPAVFCLKLGSRKHKRFYPICVECALRHSRLRKYPVEYRGRKAGKIK